MLNALSMSSKDVLSSSKVTCRIAQCKKTNKQTRIVNLAATVRHQLTFKIYVCGRKVTFVVWESVNIVLLKFLLVQQSF